MSVIRWPDRTEVSSHDPHPFAINESDFFDWFAAVRSHSDRTSILSAARLYAASLEHQWRYPEISYQLLVFAVEAVAGRAFKQWIPEDSDRLQHSASGAVMKIATEAKLDSDLSRRLALAAAEGNTWLSRKFCLFLTRFASDPTWPSDGTDSLHPNLDLPHAPKSDEFDAVLKRVYKARGGVVHAGGRIPDEAFLGANTRLSPEAFVALMAPTEPFPPLPWFERVLNQAINSFCRSPQP
jgi:hypothetical protein